MRVPSHPTLIRRMLNKRLKQIGAHRPAVGASLVEAYRLCGKSGCRCTRGHKHRGHHLTFKVKGKTRSVYVPVDLTKEVQSWIDEHRRLKKLLAEISQLTLALIRSHVQEKKNKRGRS